ALMLEKPFRPIEPVPVPHAVQRAKISCEMASTRAFAQLPCSPVGLVEEADGNAVEQVYGRPEGNCEPGLTSRAKGAVRRVVCGEQKPSARLPAVSKLVDPGHHIFIGFIGLGCEFEIFLQ